MNLKILTFNWHEPYICNLSGLNHAFYVVAPEIAPGRFREWDTRMRPIPSNCQLISIEQAKEKLQEGDFDLALAHNVKDLLWLKEYDVPKICVFHCRLTTELALSQSPINKSDYLNTVKGLLVDVHSIFISENKKADWNLPGAVISHGIDVDQFPEYSGEQVCILRVGNLLKEMDIARGFSKSEKILSGLPSATLGLNPTLPGARLSESYEDLLEHYRQCRVYLNTLPPAYEDGHNLSLLEAMATGMPVISTAHPESPVKDGINGFISDDLDYLRAKCEELLKDEGQAVKLGKNARQTVRDQFPMEGFLSGWNREIEICIKEYLKSRGYHRANFKIPFSELKRKNILMDFVSHPATTAYYLERAFRQHHNVITCGAMINLDVIHKWDLGELKWPVEPQDIFRGTGEGVDSVLKQLPAGWSPDFYLYVETGLSDIPVDLEELTIPKVCYLIDTHLHLEKHIEIAARFDVVFLAQKEYVDTVKSKTNSEVFWLPLGCDPEIHRKVDVEKLWDVGFVGSVTPANPRRKQLLDLIQTRFDLKVDRKFMDEMARLFCQSRIVFNNAIRDDLNMRVFEVLCTGSLLVTDDAVGLTELFVEGKHFVKYEDDNLLETVRYYLDHPDEREIVAKAGREKVLASHTYGHRIKQIIETLNSLYSSPENKPKKSSVVKEADSTYYQHIRHDMLPLIPQEARSILEIGCGAGRTGQYLKERNGAFVAGVELNETVALEAKEGLNEVTVGDIEKLELAYEPASFDCVLCLDVLEHLVNPLDVLKKLKTFLTPGGVLVASIPNVQFFGIINHLAEGNWTYQDEGILDRTHLRFFTFKEIETLFKDAGFEMGVVEETLDPQYEEYLKSGQTSLKVGRVTIHDLTPEELRRFFVFQYRFTVSLPENNQTAATESSSFQSNIEQQLSDAKLFEQDEQWSKALNIYNGILESHPKELKGWEGKGNCHLRLQEFKQSQSAFAKGHDINPDSPEIILGLAVLAFQIKDFIQAENWFETVLNIDSHKDRGLCGLGMLKQTMDDNSTAMEFYAEALRINPENNTAMASILKLAYSTGEFGLAETVLKNYLDVHPANLNMLFGLAGIYFEQAQFEEAREVIERIFIFDDNHSDANQLLEKIQSQPTYSKG